MNALIVEAIEKKRTLKFVYDRCLRTVEPHSYGVAVGGEAIRAYQTGGTSPSGTLPAWRLFYVKKIRKLTLGPQTFPRARPDYRYGDPDMRTLFAEV